MASTAPPCLLVIYAFFVLAFILVLSEAVSCATEDECAAGELATDTSSAAALHLLQRHAAMFKKPSAILDAPVSTYSAVPKVDFAGDASAAKATLVSANAARGAVVPAVSKADGAGDISVEAKATAHRSKESVNHNGSLMPHSNLSTGASAPETHKGTAAPLQKPVSSSNGTVVALTSSPKGYAVYWLSGSTLAMVLFFAFLYWCMCCF